MACEYSGTKLTGVAFHGDVAVAVPTGPADALEWPRCWCGAVDVATVTDGDGDTAVAVHDVPA